MSEPRESESSEPEGEANGEQEFVVEAIRSAKLKKHYVRYSHLFCGIDHTVWPFAVFSAQHFPFFFLRTAPDIQQHCSVLFNVYLSKYAAVMLHDPRRVPA